MRPLDEVTSVSFWDHLLGTPLQIIAVIVIAVVARWLCNAVIRRVVRDATQRRESRLRALPGRAGRALERMRGSVSERQGQRTRTMGSILSSIVTVTIVTIAIITILALLNIPVAPLLASAGVGGVALGFGAQSLVKDFLSGIFMIVEDQYGVGDVIDTGTVTGTVEDVSLRVTQLRDANGVVWYVRNGEILRIGNKSQGWSTAIVDIPIAVDQDVQQALSILRTVVAEVDADPSLDGKLLEEPEVVGVESIAAGSVLLRVTAKCAPQEQFGVQREIRERARVAFAQHGIRLPSLAYSPPAAAPTAGSTPLTGGPANPPATH